MRTTDSTVSKSHQRVAQALAILAVLVATLLIVGTYRTFNQTFDEPAHVASGMEWLDRGQYTYDYMNTPLARVAVAIGPYLVGLRSHGDISVFKEGNLILESNGKYQSNLTLARLGVLPFFWLCCGLIWHLTSRYMGLQYAAISVFLFSTIPTVLAHSSVATTDMPATGLFLLVLTIWLHWRQDPVLWKSICFGAAIGLALLAKYSTLPFLIVTLSALTLSDGITLRRLRLLVKPLAVTCVAMLLTIWGGYRFSVGRLLDKDSYVQVNRIVGTSGRLHDATYRVLSNVPAYEFFRGLLKTLHRNHEGGFVYFLGHVSPMGHWYFFPVLLATKLPISILVLVVLGVMSYANARKNKRDFEFLRLVMLGIFCPLLVACSSSINLGLRHVLPIMPFVAMLAGVGVWNIGILIKQRTAKWVFVTALIGANAISCWSVAPDFLAYFNEPSRRYASLITVDSDVDWGQDLNRLCTILALHPVNSPVLISYFGSADLSSFPLPPWHELAPGVKTKGIIAISLYNLKTYPEQFGWLEAYRPVQLIGHSILLYDIQ